MSDADRDAMIEAASQAVYETMPIVLKDLVSRAEAEGAIGVPHGAGVPDRWLAAAVLDVVRPLILKSAADELRAKGDDAYERLLALSSYREGLHDAADLLERLADGNTTTEETPA